MMDTERVQQPPIPDEWLAEMAVIARKVTRRYLDSVDLQDVQQELALWWLEKPVQAATWAADEEKHGFLRKSMYRAARRYAERERAARIGYELDDLYHYSTGVLIELLPHVLAPETWPSMISARSQDLSGRSGGGDPAVGGNMLATLADVSRAFSRLDEEQQMLLRQAYSAGAVTRSEMAAELGVTDSTVTNRVWRAVKALQDQLGGPA